MVDPLAGMPICLIDGKPSPLFPKDLLDHLSLMKRYRYIGSPSLGEEVQTGFVKNLRRTLRNE